MKNYIVYLYRSPDCIRGWLAYVRSEYPDRCTLTVSVTAENGSKAKNKAITQANKDLNGLDILRKNYDDELWGINNFPELKDKLNG